MTGAFPLQIAVYDALRASAAVKAVVGDPARVYDDVPEAVVHPYIAIGDGRAEDWSTKSSVGTEAFIDLHAWSRHRGRKEVKEILAAVHGALHNAALAVTGQTLVLLQFDFADDFLDADGLTRHGVARFRALLQQN